jgi:hypothetical protein
MDTAFLTASEVERLPDVLTDRTQIVFFETPTNPTLDVFDIAAITAQAYAVGALVVVDNTFATPVNQNPLHHGADLASTPPPSTSAGTATSPPEPSPAWPDLISSASTAASSPCRSVWAALCWAWAVVMASAISLCWVR